MDDIKALKEKVKDLKLLFVDDEKDVRDGSGIFLNKFFDDVTICVNGEDGYDTFLKEKDFDVVITDIKMPKMNGVEMAKKIREMDPNVYIVFLTASRTMAQIDHNLGNLSLQKPLSFEDMVQVLKELGSLKCQY